MRGFPLEEEAGAYPTRFRSLSYHLLAILFDRNDRNIGFPTYHEQPGTVVRDPRIGVSLCGTEQSQSRPGFLTENPGISDGHELKVLEVDIELIRPAPAPKFGITLIRSPSCLH